MQFSYVSRSVCACGAARQPDSPKVEVALTFGTVSFVRCPRCSSYFQSPQIDAESLNQWVDSDEYQSRSIYLDYMANEAQRRIESEARYRHSLASLLPKASKVLEIGCATGSLLSVIKDHGHSVKGLDLSPKFAERARVLYGLDVEVTSFLEFSDVAGSYDAILMLGTVCNLQDLNAQLEHAHSLLKPGGVLYFNLPYVDSLPHRLYGKRYWMFTPSIFNFLSIPGVRLALRAAGFEIGKVQTDLQKPAVSKVLGHSKLKSLYPLIRRLGLGSAALPFALPIPGIKLVIARKIAQ